MNPEFYDVVRDLRQHWQIRTDHELIMLALAELLEAIEIESDGQPAPYIRALRTELVSRVGRNIHEPA